MHVHLRLLLLALGGGIVPGIHAAVSLSPAVATAGSLITATLKSLWVTIAIPESVIFANAQRAAGWSLNLKYRNESTTTTTAQRTVTLVPQATGPTLTATPEVSEFQPALNLTENTPTLSSVTWSNGKLAPGEFGDFEVLIMVPNGPEGKRIYFPVFQYCGPPSSSVLAFNARTEGPGISGEPLLPVPPVSGPAPTIAAITTTSTAPSGVLLSVSIPHPAPFITLAANGTALSPTVGNEDQGGEGVPATTRSAGGMRVVGVAGVEGEVE
ncbi:hypothetical protein HDU96_010388 [Phlyctochytrium bullatum]|nr:hypothetical protein HDU96_010388 [Phlyctochytrium bullatum]